MVVKVHKDHFASGTHDDVWIPEVVRRGWVILTQDKNLRHKPNEREALTRAGARAFVFTGAEMKGEDAANAVIAARPKMERTIAHTEPPFVATVSRIGAVAIRWPQEKREP